MNADRKSESEARPHRAADTVGSMTPLTLAAIDEAFHRAFALDTCAEDDLPFWTIDNPSRGHCAVAALTLNDLLGGDLLLAEVERDDVKVGYHYWNSLAGVEVDMTRAQFFEGEVVLPAQVVKRPPGPPKTYADQYDRFRHRVNEALGVSSPS